MQAETVTIRPQADAWGVSNYHSPTPLALILADDPQTDLGGLTAQHTKAALPFAGKYRLIDLALSSCIHSGIRAVGVISQYQPRSLIAHLAYGRPWDLDREGGLTPLLPYQACGGNGQPGGIDWYMGTADAIHRNRDFVLHSRADETLVLFGGEIHDVDLSALMVQHRQTGADLTVAVAPVEKRHLGQLPTVTHDDEGNVQGLAHSGPDDGGQWALVGVLLFSTAVLIERLSQDARRPGSTHDLVGDVIPGMIKAGDRVMAFQHRGYCSKLQTVDDYWRASMDLIGEPPKFDLGKEAWPIRTLPEVRLPARISAGARVCQSLICEGCIVEGTVEYSVLSPGVQVGRDAIVRRAVVWHDVCIEARAQVEDAILDEKVVVGSHARVGVAHHRAPTPVSSQLEPITVLGRGVRVSPTGEVGPTTAHGDWFPVPPGGAAARIRAGAR